MPLYTTTFSWSSILRNHFVTKITFKIDLGMMIDLGMTQCKIFHICAKTLAS